MGDESDPDMFTLVVKKRKNPNPTSRPTQYVKKSRTTQQELPTQNRYESLSDDSDDEVPEIEMSTATPGPSSQPPSAPTTNSTKKAKPKPVVLHGEISSNKKMRQYIEKHTHTNQYEIKHGFNRTTIYFHEEGPQKVFSELLKKNKMNFHLYTPDKDKTHSFVLCGLDIDTELDELEEELKSIDQLHVQKVFRMNNTRLTKFLVITNNSVTMKSVENIKVISRTRVTWQRYYNNKIFIQCHRCQQWGHATSNCFSTPNCLKCAQQHLTRDCTLSDDHPAKCVNCDGDHPANSTDCRVYKKLLENYQRRNNSTQKQTQPVPDINSTTEFRPLRPPKTPVSQVWRATNSQPERVTVDQKVSDEQNDYTDMMAELKKLNSLIDMKTFTARLRVVNEILSNCKTEVEKFNAMNKFYLDLDNNGK